jgi:hypothetical protein
MKYEQQPSPPLSELTGSSDATMFNYHQRVRRREGKKLERTTLEHKE